MSERQIFKVAILSHDEPLFERLFDVFGIDFEKAMTQTSGAAFSYSHFHIEEGQRLTAQFWMLDGSPQWSSIRNLYMKGASGIILLHDPSIKNATAINKRLLREFVSANRFPVPIIVLNVSEDDNSKETDKFAKDIERWSGYNVLSIHQDDNEIETKLNEYMNDVKDWRARNVIFQTLKLYFSIDAINNTSRAVNKIIRQLRRIYTSRYYELLSDEDLFSIVLQAIMMEGFEYDPNEKCVLYQKDTMRSPWSTYEQKLGPNEYKKPKVERL